MLSKLYTITTWMTRFVGLNVLLALFNLPLLYVSLDIIVGEMEQLKLVLMTLAILAPFFLFPATAATYGVVRKWVLGDTEISVIRSFLKYYRENYVRSFTGGILFTILWISIIFNFLFLSSNHHVIMNIIYAVLAALLLAWNIKFISYIVHFDNKVLPTLKNTIVLTVGSPFTSIGIVLIHIGVIYISLKVPIVALLCSGSITAYLSFLFFNQIIKNISFLQQPAENENK